MADAEQEIQALKAEVMYLTEVLGQRQNEVKDLADRRKAAIRELVERGVTQAEVARMAGISYQAVQQLLR